MLNRDLIKEAKGVFPSLALTVLLGLGVGLMAVGQAYFLARVVDGVFLAGWGLGEARSWLLLLLGVILLRAIFTGAGEWAGYRTAARVKETLRRRLLAHLMDLGPGAPGKEGAGERVNLLVEGVEALEAYFARYLPQLALAVLVPSLVLVFVFPRDLTSALILLATAPLLPIFMLLIGRWADALTQSQWQALSRMSGHFLEVIQGLTTLKLYGRAKAQAGVIGRVSDEFALTTLGILRVAFLSALALELLATISTALVAVTLGLRLLYGTIPFEQAFFILLLAPEFYLPLRALGSQFHAGMAGNTAAEAMFRVLETPIPPRPAGQQTLPQNQALEVVFEEVSYAYEEGTRPALQEASFTLGAGERVALVGSTGAGKSTIAHLLLGFLQPQKGRIIAGGVPLDQMVMEEWRQRVALVPQNPYLFYGTVADNLRLGRPEASDAQVEEAARLAGAHDFILDLPRGYDTVLGERGFGLSGGQGQRLAIARAFLKDAPLLILDEPTAGLDPQSEVLIQEALGRLMVGRTGLIIAHRLASAYRADRIIVLERGQVVEWGSHDQLLSRRGVYHRLVVTAFPEMA